jgi:hypothetical protein
MTERAAGRLLTAGLLLLPAALFVAESWSLKPQIDDAYISYRYAANLVEGHGLVYNPGEYVEGFTNLFWTLLVAGGLALGFEATATAHALGIASGLAILAATFLYARALLSTRSGAFAALATWVVAASIPFALWSTSGMETPLFVATATATLAAHARNRMGWATFFVSLATLTRPEGGILAAVLFGFHVSSAWRAGWRPWFYPLAYAVLLALLTVFRLGYYGSPVPNTFYAKVGGVPIEQGVHYLIIFLLHGPMFLLVPGVVALARDRRVWAGGAFALAFGGYVVWVGGDAFPGGRFLFPLLPCLAVLAVRGAAVAYAVNRYLGILLALIVAFEVVWQFFGFVPSPYYLVAPLLALAWGIAIHVERPRRVAGVTLALAAAYMFIDVVGGVDSVKTAFRSSLRTQSLEVQRGKYRLFEERAARRVEVLRARDEPIRLVATAGIGSFGYYSRLPVLDILGLVDATIARSPAAQPAGAPTLPGHHRSNVAYIFERRPDYILVPQEFAKGVAANRAIWEHPDLEAHYAWDEEIVGYRRRSEAQEDGATPR